jgi:integral membrane sensor domain MASE1
MPQHLRRAAVVAALFLLTAFVSRLAAHADTMAVPVWLASGVTFAALLIGDRWSWPATLVGAAVASLVWAVAAHGLGPMPAAAFTGIEVVSMAVGAFIARLGRREPDSFTGVALLIAGMLAASALGALLAVELWHWQQPGAAAGREWMAWASSTMVGLLLIVPVATSFLGFRIKRSGGLPMGQFLGGLLAFGAFVVAVLVVFADHSGQRFGSIASTLAYVPMPFLLVASLLWGARGGTLAILLGSLLIIGRSAHGFGPFSIIEGFPGEAVIEAQGFVATWAAVLLLLRALSEGRQSALLRARDWRLRYERTLQAVGVAAVEYDAATGQALWGEGAAEVLGSAVEGVNSVGEWLDRIDPGERALVQATWSAVARGELASSEQTYQVQLPEGGSLRVRERLAGVRGGVGEVERVTALLRPDTSEQRHG